MKIRPILFNTDMVRAILYGKKTVTRRVIKFPDGQTGRLPECGARDYIFYPSGIKYAPYKSGDILYVREAYCPNYFDEGIAGYRGDGMRGNRNAYKADYRKEIIGDVVPEPKWKPSIHMPREAARIFLKVTDVRVEQLQDINGNEVLKEGLDSHVHPKADYFNMNQREMFGNLWNSTIKKKDLHRYGWEANPWVWVIEFERCKKPNSLSPEQEGDRFIKN